MPRKTAAQKKIEVMNQHIAGLNLQIVALKEFIKEVEDILDKQKICSTIDAQVIGFLVQLLVKERSGSNELTPLDLEARGLKDKEPGDE